MPTAGGWRLLVVGVVAVVAGRAAGLLELYVIGAAAMAAVVIALAIRLLHPSWLAVGRRVATPLVAVGEPVRVSVDVVNRARLRSSTVRISDHVSTSGDVRLTVAPLSGGEAATGRYRLETTHRGVLDVGPMVLDDIDSLGLARRRRRVESYARVIVHPPVEVLTPSRAPLGGDLSVRSEFRPRPLGIESDEFDILRPYVSGDDPRHIHWPTTARFDELTVRRFQSTRPGRFTVVIDTRPPGDLVTAQDRTTSVAASIASAVLRGGDEARIVTTDGRGTPLLSHSALTGAALEFLALLSGGRPDIDVDAPADGSVVVVVSASPDVADDHNARDLLAQRLRASLVVTYGTGLPETAVVGSGAGTDWIHLTGAGQLAGLWRVPASTSAGVSAPT